MNQNNPTPVPVPTPRTDANSFYWPDTPAVCVEKLTTADFARTLERELAQAKAELARITTIGPVSGASEGDVYQWLRDAQSELATTKAALQSAQAALAQAKAENANLASAVGLAAYKARAEKAESDLAATKAALAEAQQDKERLDELSSQRYHVIITVNGREVGRKGYFYENIRHCIDAARAEREGGVK